MISRYRSGLLLLLILFFCSCSGKPEPVPSQTSPLPPAYPETISVVMVSPAPTDTQTATPPHPHPQPTSTPSPRPTATPEPDIYQKLKREYARSIADIPAELRTGNVSFSPIFRNIPEIQALRDGMSAAPTAEKWVYVAQIVALIGVQTREELQGLAGPGYRVERWHSRDEDGRRLLTCNTYATTVLHALGLGEDMSHWFSPQGVPQFNVGIEYQARQTQRWLQDRGEEFGWQDVSQLSPDKRLDLLKNGYVIIGVNQVHMWLVFGAVDENGQVMPVLTQSIPNFLFIKPGGSQFQRPGEGTLFAHRLP